MHHREYACRLFMDGQRQGVDKQVLAVDPVELARVGAPRKLFAGQGGKEGNAVIPRGQTRRCGDGSSLAVENGDAFQPLTIAEALHDSLQVPGRSLGQSRLHAFLETLGQDLRASPEVLAQRLLLSPDLNIRKKHRHQRERNNQGADEAETQSHGSPCFALERSLNTLTPTDGWRVVNSITASAGDAITGDWRRAIKVKP